MATFTNPRQLASHQRRRAQNVRRSLTIEAASLVRGQKEEALKLTSGTVSTKRLSQMGHPFGRMTTGNKRKGRMRGTLARLPINRQTGRLQQSLRVFHRYEGGNVVWRLQFMAPHGKFVLARGGTRKMVARGFWTALRKRYEREKKRFKTALLRAHKLGG